MQYPTREAEILRLANDIAAALATHTDVFPAPPFSPEDFQNALGEHDGNREAAILARASAAQSTDAKERSLARIDDMSKSVIRYAENHTRGDDGTLQLLGWGAHRSRTLTITEPPGQVRTLEIIREGKDWVFLDWKEPTEGGEVAAFSTVSRSRGCWRFDRRSTQQSGYSYLSAMIGSTAVARRAGTRLAASPTTRITSTIEPNTPGSPGCTSNMMTRTTRESAKAMARPIDRPTAISRSYTGYNIINEQNLARAVALRYGKHLANIEPADQPVEDVSSNRTTPRP